MASSPNRAGAAPQWVAEERDAEGAGAHTTDTIPGIVNVVAGCVTVGMANDPRPAKGDVDAGVVVNANGDAADHESRPHTSET
jgi:hypothetical protein